jgi:hypothetical protein
MPVSRANGLDIYYETAGAGPPLVLIDALPFDHHLWLYQICAFGIGGKEHPSVTRPLGFWPKTRSYQLSRMAPVEAAGRLRASQVLTRTERGEQ